MALFFSLTDVDDVIWKSYLKILYFCVSQKYNMNDNLMFISG